MEPIAPEGVCHTFATRFDTARTLTNGRTDGRNERPSRLEESSSVPNAPIGVEEEGIVDIATAFDEAVDEITSEHPRLPVYNRLPRPPAEYNRDVWHALMVRDGGKCWLCGTTDAFMVADHIFPRSAYEPKRIDRADRTDNLRIACWDCNSSKSNRFFPFRRPLPIVWGCPTWYSEEGWPEYLIETMLTQFSEETMTAWCHRHRAACIVPESWPVVSLRWPEEDEL